MSWLSQKWRAIGHRVKGFRWLALTALFVIISSVLTASFLFGGKKTGYYLGFAIAASGIAVAILQAYIATIVSSILLYRKHYYVWSSATLAFLGVGNLFSALRDMDSTGSKEIDALLLLSQVCQIIGLVFSVRLFGLFLFTEPHESDLLNVSEGHEGLSLWERFKAFILEIIPDAVNVSDIQKSLSKTEADIVASHDSDGRGKRRKIKSFIEVGNVLIGLNFSIIGTAFLGGIYYGVVYLLKGGDNYTEVARAIPSVVGALCVVQIIAMSIFRAYMIIHFERTTRSYAAVVGFSLFAMIPALIDGWGRWFPSDVFEGGVAVAVVLWGVCWGAISGTRKNQGGERPTASGMKLHLNGMIFALFSGGMFALLYGGLLWMLNDKQLLWNGDARIFVYGFQLSYVFLILGSAYVVVGDLEYAGALHRAVADRYFSGAYQRGLAHEIINPLAPVKNFLSAPELAALLQPTGASPQAMPSDERRALLVDGLPIMQRAVDRVLQFAQGLREDGVLRSDTRQRIELVGYVANFIRDYKTTMPSRYTQFSEPNQISISIDAKITGAYVFVQERFLPNILRVLLDNAVEATDSSRPNAIVVRIGNADKALPTGSAISLQIQDTGRGMTESQKKKFGKEQRSTKSGGHGIGVAAISSFIEKMGGDISVCSSKRGEGTVIEVRFPNNSAATLR